MVNLLLCFSVAVFSLSSCQQNQSVEFDETFVHSVYIWLKNPDDANDRKAFETSLDKFLKSSRFAKTKYVGTPPKATRSVVDDTFTYNLVVTFPSEAAQTGYQEEEAHKLFIEESSHLWKKVIVYDSKTIR
ncbi:MAG: Dabb family protein [Cyclobacteriaceae bacterium]